MARTDLLKCLVIVPLAIAAHSAAAAQAPAVPVAVLPKSVIGVDRAYTLESGYGRHTTGGVIPVALSAAINGDRFGLAAGVAWLAAPDDDVESGVGAGVAIDWQVTRFDPERNPYIWNPMVRIRAGASYSALDEKGVGTWKQIDVPIVFGMGWVLPANELVATPWVAPRAHLRFLVDVPGGGESSSEAGAGLSAGLDIFKANCPPLQPDCSRGFGGRLGAEVLGLDDPRTGDSVHWAVTLGLVWRRF